VRRHRHDGSVHGKGFAVSIKLVVMNVLVNDQDKALDFYTRVLGFVAKNDIRMGDARWLTVVSPAAPDGPELLLEPMQHGALVDAAHAWQAALRQNAIPAAMFGVDDVNAEYARITALGYHFESGPASAGPVRHARIDDGCGNLVQLTQYVR
jgi:catechol 2,3-dioxygenase-like lactoylglutathione lyase family enzyme